MASGGPRTVAAGQRYARCAGNGSVLPEEFERRGSSPGTPVALLAVRHQWFQCDCGPPRGAAAAWWRAKQESHRSGRRRRDRHDAVPHVPGSVDDVRAAADRGRQAACRGCRSGDDDPGMARGEPARSQRGFAHAVADHGGPAHRHRRPSQEAGPASRDCPARWAARWASRSSVPSSPPSTAATSSSPASRRAG
jgi:hypothetical protein